MDNKPQATDAGYTLNMDIQSGRIVHPTYNWYSRIEGVDDNLTGLDVGHPGHPIVFNDGSALEWDETETRWAAIERETIHRNGTATLLDPATDKYVTVPFEIDRAAVINADKPVPLDHILYRQGYDATGNSLYLVQCEAEENEQRCGLISDGDEWCPMIALATSGRSWRCLLNFRRPVGNGPWKITKRWDHESRLAYLHATPLHEDGVVADETTGGH